MPLLLKTVPHHFSVGFPPNFTEQAPRAVPSNGGMLPWPPRARPLAASSPTGSRAPAPPNITVGPPPTIRPLLAEALNRPTIHPHYYPEFSLFPLPPPLYPPAHLPQPLGAVSSPRTQISAPGSSTSYSATKKPRRIAPKPRKSSEIDILTVETLSVPSSSSQPVSGPATEIISLPLIENQPAPSVSPPRMAEPASLVADDSEQPLGDQFQSLQPKRRRNNIA